jgi:DNA-binding response OmpR family regulator
MHVLVVEDDSRMAALLKRGLEAEGHRVLLARDGREGIELAGAGTFDVIVLDVMLPWVSGLEVARQLRASQNHTPILMLTAKDTPQDAVSGLDTGADDYLTKPFAFEELLARIRAVSRRGPVPQLPLLRVADLWLNPASHQVGRGDHELALTPKEFQLLELLMRRHPRVVSRDAILEVVWGPTSEVELNTVDVFVSNLRRKLESSGGPRLVVAVRGVGYRLGEPEP